MTTEPKAFRSIATQKILAVDSHERVVAAVTYRHHRELNDSVVFGMEENNDGKFALKSGHNGLYLCLDNEELMARCNASIEGQTPELFDKICSNSDCRMFGLRSSTNKKLLTVLIDNGENEGLIKAFHYFSITYKICQPPPLSAKWSFKTRRQLPRKSTKIGE